MLMLLLAALLTQDKSKAATSFDEGSKHLKEARYERAIEAFDSALKVLNTEDPNLSYRGPGITVRVAYYPYFYAGLAALRWAPAAQNPEEKQRRLALALTHLGRSIHPEAVQRQAEARQLMAALGTPPPPVAPAPPPAADPFPQHVAKLKVDLDQLGRDGRFEEALKSITQAAFLAGREAERKELMEAFRAKQAQAVGQREIKLTSGIERLAAEDPLRDTETQVKVLREAQIPREVQKEPPPSFRWLEGFVSELDRQKPAIAKVAALDEAMVVETSDAFEGLAQAALEAGYFPGFRAARNIAHALRLSRMKALPAAELPAEDKWSRAVRLEAAAKKSEEALLVRLVKVQGEAFEGELKRYLEETVKSQQSGLAVVRGTLPSPDMKNRLVQAERSLQDPEAAADAARLRGVAGEIVQLQGDARFGVLQAGEQARALMAGAVALATAALLEGEPRDQIVGRLAPLVGRAQSLDAGALAVADVSPKILALFDEARRR